MIDSDYLKSLAEIWGEPRIRTLRVQVNSRLRSTVARSKLSSNTLEINKRVSKRSATSQREIMCHEAAHHVVWRRYGTTVNPHGAEWAALMRSAGFKPRATFIKCGEFSRRQRMPVAFRHTCPVCHFSKRARRRMTLWRCPECSSIGLHGELNIEPLSAEQ